MVRKNTLFLLFFCRFRLFSAQQSLIINPLFHSYKKVLRFGDLNAPPDRTFQSFVQTEYFLSNQNIFSFVNIGECHPIKTGISQGLSFYPSNIPTCSSINGYTGSLSALFDSTKPPHKYQSGHLLDGEWPRYPPLPLHKKIFESVSSTTLGNFSMIQYNLNSRIANLRLCKQSPNGLAVLTSSRDATSITYQFKISINFYRLHSTLDPTLVADCNTQQFSVVYYYNFGASTGFAGIVRFPNFLKPLNYEQCSSEECIDDEYGALKDVCIDIIPSYRLIVKVAIDTPIINGTETKVLPHWVKSTNNHCIGFPRDVVVSYTYLNNGTTLRNNLIMYTECRSLAAVVSENEFELNWALFHTCDVNKDNEISEQEKKMYDYSFAVVYFNCIENVCEQETDSNGGPLWSQLTTTIDYDVFEDLSTEDKLWYSQNFWTFPGIKNWMRNVNISLPSLIPCTNTTPSNLSQVPTIEKDFLVQSVAVGTAAGGLLALLLTFFLVGWKRKKKTIILHKPLAIPWPTL